MKQPEPGNVVVIMNNTPSGKSIIEGDAILIRCLNPDYGLFPDYIVQLWEVQFTDDVAGDTVSRQVRFTKPPVSCCT